MYEIAKNHPIDLGMLGDPKLSLAMLADALEATMTAAQKDAAQGRSRELAEAKEAKRQAELRADAEARGQTPLRMAQFMEELAPRLPANTVIFDEALTSSPAVARYFQPSRTGQYFLTRGGSLGVGFPGAIGAKLANPDSTVFGFSGDGGSMYTIQALWSAARHNIDTKFVVCNNGSYRLLQLNIDAYWKEQGVPKHDFPLSFDLSYPALHFADMARGMGVPGVRIEGPGDIGPAVSQALDTKGPFLIDLVLEGDTHPDRVGNTCGQ